MRAALVPVLLLALAAAAGAACRSTTRWIPRGDAWTPLGEEGGGWLAAGVEVAGRIGADPEGPLEVRVRSADADPRFLRAPSTRSYTRSPGHLPVPGTDLFLSATQRTDAGVRVRLESPVGCAESGRTVWHLPPVVPEGYRGTLLPHDGSGEAAPSAIAPGEFHRGRRAWPELMLVATTLPAGARLLEDRLTWGEGRFELREWIDLPEPPIAEDPHYWFDHPWIGLVVLDHHTRTFQVWPLGGGTFEARVRWELFPDGTLGWACWAPHPGDARLEIGPGGLRRVPPGDTPWRPAAEPVTDCPDPRR